MRPSEGDIVAIWEAGANAPAWQRALLLARHELDGADPADVPLGERDAALWRLRQRWFGSYVESHTRCPGCAEGVEVSFEVDAIVRPAAAPVVSPTLEWRGVSLAVRPPSTRDVVEGATAAALTARCLPPDHSELAADPELQQAVARRCAELDPLADVTLDLQCAACGAPWLANLDVVRFLWAEVSDAAERTLATVALLAAYYGWSEADILAMSPARRAFYLRAADA